MRIDWSRLADAVGNAEQSPGCTLGVSVIAPSGERFDHRADRAFVAASTVKIPIMIALFRQVDAGRRSLADRYLLRDEDRAPGSGVILHLQGGIAFALADLAYLMMSISDNTATNVLIDFVGMDEVNAVMRDLGMAGSNLGRKMMGRRAQDGEAENWARPGEYADVTAAILSGRAASPSACDEMVALLEKQQNDRRIARALPRVGGRRWGSKTGSLPGLVNDVGFIVTDGRPVVISVFCEDPPDAHRGEEIIGAISAAAMACVTPAIA